MQVSVGNQGSAAIVGDRFALGSESCGWGHGGFVFDGGLRGSASGLGSQGLLDGHQPWFS
jgi:hypothetical protein